jgi:FemAB-related protein (PEP-CTERM system-associated)
MMTSISRLDPNDILSEGRWDAFVAECPATTFFHRAGWQRILRESVGHDTHYLYCEVDGRIDGILPLAHVRSVLFGQSLVSLPFAVYGGVAARSVVAAQALEAHAQALAQQLGVSHLELRNTQPRHADWPVQDLYVTFRKPILPSIDENMLAIPRKQRAMVRKGIKNGLRSEIDNGVDRFFPLYADNVHRHGTPGLSKRWFESLLREFGSDAEVLTVVGPDGQALSSVLSFYFRDEVLPYYAGDLADARELAGNDFKYWELMRRACERGVQVFDYGRSKRESGSFSFKKNWGFEPRPLHYEFRLYKRDTIPQNNPNNGRFKLAIEAWRRMPLAMANVIGPYVVRGLG